MRRRAAFVSGICLLAAASCGSASPPLFTVAELVPRIDELNGKTVRVAGYLGDCSGYECGLYPSKDDFAAWTRTIAELRKGNRPEQPRSPVLGIGTGEQSEFDSKAVPFTDRYVVITGKVSNQCRSKGEPACTDRSTDLDPISIAAWSGPVPPPPQSQSAKV